MNGYLSLCDQTRNQLAPLIMELVGFKQITPFEGIWCGNEIYTDAFTLELRKKTIKLFIQLFGNHLREEGFGTLFTAGYPSKQNKWLYASLVKKDVKVLIFFKNTSAIFSFYNLKNKVNFCFTVSKLHIE